MMPDVKAVLLAACLVALAAHPATLGAQVADGAERPARRLRPELRVDYIGARTHVVHAGVGISVPAGTYARLGAAAGVGPGWGDGSVTSARADATLRFLIDPFRRSRWGLSVGGGLGALHDGSDLRGLALLFADVEGPGDAGWIPFAGVGVGGGVRVTLGLRRAASAGR
jgi:hypothetical protein